MARVVLLVAASTTFIAAVICAAVDGKADQGGCSCGVFPENDLQSAPIIEQSLQYNVSCDEEGAGICQNLCIALAQGARDQAPVLICEKLDKRVENLKVAVFTKTSCDAKNEWNFTGLKSPEPICCDGGKETACDNPSPIFADTTNE